MRSALLMRDGDAGLRMKLEDLNFLHAARRPERGHCTVVLPDSQAPHGPISLDRYTPLLFPKTVGQGVAPRGRFRKHEARWQPSGGICREYSQAEDIVETSMNRVPVLQPVFTGCETATYRTLRAKRRTSSVVTP